MDQQNKILNFHICRVTVDECFNNGHLSLNCCTNEDADMFINIEEVSKSKFNSEETSSSDGTGETLEEEFGRDWKIFPLTLTVTDDLCVQQLNDLILNGKIPKDKIM